MFKAEKSDRVKTIPGTSYHNDKPNVLIFGGNLARNGITTSLKALLSTLDTSKRNYLLTFFSDKVEKNKLEINNFNNVDYMPIQGRQPVTRLQATARFLYYRLGIHIGLFRKDLKKIAFNEMHRQYPGITFDYAIHYSGYELRALNTLTFLNNSTTRLIYVHNDMFKEASRKGNVNIMALREAYDNFERIVCVRESQKQEVLNLFPQISPDKLTVAHNIVDVNGILKKATMPMQFDEKTWCNVEERNVQEILQNPNNIIIVNIGRFSPEKGQMRLIKAFKQHMGEAPNAYLFVIGGYGSQFKDLKEAIGDICKQHDCDLEDHEQVSEPNSCIVHKPGTHIYTPKNLNEAILSRVVLINNMSNPYPILGRANLFFLASEYEGLPVTLFEAMVLKRSIISTDIPGPRQLLKGGYGALCDNSETGIEKALGCFLDKSTPQGKEFDASAHNTQALFEFEDALAQAKKPEAPPS